MIYAHPTLKEYHEIKFKWNTYDIISNIFRLAP